MSLLVGVDIGGTFTDLVMQDEATGEVRVAKVPSTPQDPSVGLVRGLEALEVPFDRIGLIIHGTTVATNAVLERKGARCGLIMTRGFRDVLELRRRDRPDTYGLKGQFTPLVPRERRLEVDERTDYRGTMVEAPPEEQVAEAGRELLAMGVEVVIVSFLNSYANPENEQKALRVLQGLWPNPYVVAASDVLPEIREFERTSTAVLNGYVQPLVHGYLSNLMASLRERGYRNDVLLIQSNGGVMSQEVAPRQAVNTILSGPAAGVIAACHIGQTVGEDNLVTCDIGGTSLDIAVVENGLPGTAQEISLEYGIPMRTTLLNIRTLGAGGGSIAWIDRAGLLNIGPESAGAEPGPACYGQGGTRPTVTDANLVLGRIGLANPIGREAGWRFDLGRAQEAIDEMIARPLGLSVTDAAWAILQVTNHKIAGGLRALTVERGLDPRDFTLVAYGGAGPLHACALVRELEMGKAVVPPWPGITSALGCIIADVRHDFIQTLNRRLDELEPAEIYEVFERHTEEGRTLIAGEKIEVEGVEVTFHADIAYDGQIHEVRTPLPEAVCDRAAIRRAFEAAYAGQYGHTLGERPLRVRTLRTTVTGLRPKGALFSRNGAGSASGGTALKETRPVFFGEEFRDCPVYERSALPVGWELASPAVIEQSDATTVIEPGMAVRTDAYGNLIVEERR